MKMPNVCEDGTVKLITRMISYGKRKKDVCVGCVIFDRSFALLGVGLRCYVAFCCALCCSTTQPPTNNFKIAHHSSLLRITQYTQCEV